MDTKGKFFEGSIQVLVILLILVVLGKIQYILAPIGRILATILIPMIVAIFLYYMIRPLVKFLEKHRINRTISIIGVFLFIITFLGLVFLYGGTKIGSQLESMYSIIVTQINNIKGSEILNDIMDILPIGEVKESIIEAFKNYALEIGRISFEAIEKIGNVGTQILLIPIILFYLLKDGKNIKLKFIDCIPKKMKDKISILLSDIDDVLSVYISGQMSVAFIIGSLTLLAYSLIGLENAFILGMINMMLSFIPFLGPILGIVPALIIASSTGIMMSVKVVIAQVIVQQLEGNFISPLILGDRLKIHPLTVILLVMVSVAEFGILGAFVAIPVYSILRVITKNLFKDKLDMKSEGVIAINEENTF